MMRSDIIKIKMNKPEMLVETYQDFEESYRSAKAYYSRAVQFREDGYRASVVFNVGSVSLECYLISLCYLYNVEPFNHNFTCLMDSVERIVDVPEELNRDIRSLDEIFGICSVENYYHGMPVPEDSEKVLSICNKVEKLFSPDKISSVRSFFKRKCF